MWISFSNSKPCLCFIRICTMVSKGKIIMTKHVLSWFSIYNIVKMNRQYHCQYLLLLLIAKRKRKLCAAIKVSIILNCFLLMNFRKRNVKFTRRVLRLPFAFDTNVYTCLAGQKDKQSDSFSRVTKGCSVAREITRSNE